MKITTEDKEFWINFRIDDVLVARLDVEEGGRYNISYSDGSLHELVLDGLFHLVMNERIN